MKIAFQADANLKPAIWRGVRRREPSVDFEGHMGVIPDATSDLNVLRLAAEAGRVLVSPDVRTMLGHFQTFIQREYSPGLILIPSRRSTRQVIDGLLLIWRDWSPGTTAKPGYLAAWDIRRGAAVKVGKKSKGFLEKDTIPKPVGLGSCVGRRESHCQVIFKKVSSICQVIVK